MIINGPLGIGKTSAAWSLLSRFGANETNSITSASNINVSNQQGRRQRAVMLDGDYVAGALSPFDYYNQADLDYAYATCATLARHHHAYGIHYTVLNWVLESHGHVQRLTDALVAATGLPVRTFRLRCDAEVIAARIRGRMRGVCILSSVFCVCMLFQIV